MIQQFEISGKHTFCYGEKDARICLIQPISKHDLLDEEIAQIKRLTNNASFVFVGVMIDDWNAELAPWKAPAVYGKEDFGEGARQTLSYILEDLLPEINCIFGLNQSDVRYLLGGYSLAGLFALWASYQTSVFSGVAAVSPSVWFPKWDDFIQKNSIQATKVYMSLGDQEEKTKNQTMKQVSQRILFQHKMVATQIGSENCVFEWNQGNHFTDSDQRKAKAFAWLLNRKWD